MNFMDWNYSFILKNEHWFPCNLFFNVYMLLIIKRNFFNSDETSYNLNKYLTLLKFSVTSFSQLYAAMCRVFRPHKKANKQYLFTKGTNSSVCLCSLVLTRRRYL